ncbi:outer membrane protein [Nitratireductor basaltis]|uniref:Porin n=1 Tax=Nitratireductor basaltis TaxID=472175 RepID=A0A084U651_9HYPH|nr:outer membrane beta-barrel protein [Nitratireductor basaltis]KFB08437.1 Porin [Nitratireductor basaltis]
MTMRSTFFAVAAASFIAAGGASAADIGALPLKAGSERFGWTGAYAGLSAGYGWLEDVDYAQTPPFPDEGEDWIFGAHAGYLHSFGNFVVGAEAEAMRLDINYEAYSFITVENSYAFKLRAGYAFDRFLLTGHAGAVYATTDFMGLEDWGWTAGAGIDYAVTDNIVVGAQYTHFEFEQFDTSMIDATLDLATIRIGYKF